MDTDDTSAVDPTGRCCLCHRILSSVINTRGDLESMSICGNCNFSFFEDSNTTQTRYNNSLESIENMLSQQFPDLQPTISDHVNQSRQWTTVLSYTGSDSDASVDVDTFLNHDDNDEFEEVENMVGSLVGRIQLHRSLATNGRNLPNDWLSGILSDEGIRTSETLRYGDYVDVETNGSLLGAPPASIWFVKNLDCVVVNETGLVCVICKDNVCVGGVVNRLPCGHVYHPSCIVPWLNARNTCPLCRYELPTDDKVGSHQDSQERVRLLESGGGRWWFVVAPLVSVMGIGVVLWLGGRSIWWSKG